MRRPRMADINEYCLDPFGEPLYIPSRKKNATPLVTLEIFERTFGTANDSKIGLDMDGHGQSSSELATIRKEIETLDLCKAVQSRGFKLKPDTKGLLVCMSIFFSLPLSGTASSVHDIY